MTEMDTAMMTTGSKPVTVKLSKLTEGVGLLFSGILTMLEALDADTASELAEQFVQRAPAITEKESETEKADDSANAVPEEETQPTARPVFTVTIDDITKIIVRKIKQDRNNSGKIGAILKTYGAANVSSLPENKYEAFLTDIAAL